MQHWEMIPLIYIIGVTIALICYGTLEPEDERLLGRSFLWPLTLLWNTFIVIVIILGFLTMLLFRLITGFPQRSDVEKRER